MTLLELKEKSGLSYLEISERTELSVVMVQKIIKSATDLKIGPDARLKVLEVLREEAIPSDVVKYRKENGDDVTKAVESGNVKIFVDILEAYKYAQAKKSYYYSVMADGELCFGVPK